MSSNTYYIKGLVVTGMHRSGTTFVGELLRRFSSTSIIHEPLNREYGLRGVNHVYPFEHNLEQRDYYIQLIHEVLNDRASYIRTVKGDNFLKAIKRFVVGGRTGVDVSKYKIHRFFRPRIIPVLKDPFEVLMLKTLLDQGFGAIVVVRHPVAIWRSIRRMNWCLNMKELGAYECIAQDPVAAEFGDLSKAQEIVKFSLLWRMIYRHVNNLPVHENLLISTHEQICISPVEYVESINDRFHLGSDTKVHNYIKETMYADAVSVKSRELHVLKRNSSDLAKSWIGNIEKDEEELIQYITGDVVKDIYGSWYPV